MEFMLLIRTIFRELMCSQYFDRVAETNLIMDTEEAVSAFTRAGEANGVLSGIYAYNLAHSCSIIGPGDKVLDLGCGSANLLVSLAKLNPRSKFLGVDLSRRMIARGQDIIDKSALSNIELREDDMTTLASINDNSINVVLSSMALHHLPDIRELHKCLTAVWRVLAPEGRLYIFDFGRLRSLQSVKYFVRQAYPEHESILARDYTESLCSAFSVAEIKAALPEAMSSRVRVYSTIVSPMIIVLKTDRHLSRPSSDRDSLQKMIKELPCKRRKDLNQLCFFLWLGGVKWRI